MIDTLQGSWFDRRAMVDYTLAVQNGIYYWLLFEPGDIVNKRKTPSYEFRIWSEQ